jgi:hypothetical protein
MVMYEEAAADKRGANERAGQNGEEIVHDIPDRSGGFCMADDQGVRCRESAHPGEHRDEEHGRGRSPEGVGRQSGSGAIARQSPPDAKQKRTGDEARVDAALRWPCEIRRTDRRLPPCAQGETNGGDRDGRAHDEGKTGVPVTRKVQEGEDLRWIDHLRHAQPQAEQQARDQGGKDSGHVVKPPGHGG